jgi:hypothetical protein
MKEYFSHDYNARDDEKMPKLLSELGYEGYGIFWAVVEMLYKNEGYMQLDCKSIAFALHCECNCLTRIINEFDLFIIEDSKFYSESVLKRLGLRKDISEKRSNAAKIKWNAIAEQKDNKSNAIKEKKRKEKEIKEIDTDLGWSVDLELFQKLKNKYPKLFLLKYPLRYDEHIALIKDWTPEKVRDIYSEMQNYSKLEIKSESSNLTARNWLNRNKKREAENVR